MTNGMPSLLTLLVNSIREGKSAAIITKLHKDQIVDRIVLNKDGTTSESISKRGFSHEIINSAREVIDSHKVCDLINKSADEQVIIEVIRPRVKLIIFGAGHVGQAVALIGALQGYETIVVDDRREFLTRERFPFSNIQLICEEFQEVVTSLQIDQSTYIVIVTRGHQFDEVCLRGVIYSQASYIGMIGSKRRVLSIYKVLSEGGVDADLLRRVKAPIGLRIGARTPQEIAISIMAEIIEYSNIQSREG